MKPEIQKFKQKLARPETHKFGNLKIETKNSQKPEVHNKNP